jgi:glyoxylase-like metal-dependent hydrolase (beta-lactamase superfamily II)
MKHTLNLITAATILVAAAGPTPTLGQAAKPGVERLYILDCGQGRAPDQSRWSPGVNVGKPMDIVDQCYLIKHSQGWMLWDTGLTDALAAKPEGETSASSGLTWHRPKTLAAQIEQLNVKPSDIKFVAISHTHPDHIGNVELFPQQMLLVQKAEYEWPVPLGVGRFKPEHPVTKLEGDHDVFGDGSVMIISTPGHTPGHQALLVKLPKFGAVLLAGDAVHFRDNFDNRRVPGGNVDNDKTIASMNRMAEIMAKEKAQLWINHDKAQADTLKHAPDFYE